MSISNLAGVLSICNNFSRIHRADKLAKAFLDRCDYEEYAKASSVTWKIAIKAMIGMVLCLIVPYVLFKIILGNIGFEYTFIASFVMVIFMFVFVIIRIQMHPDLRKRGKVLQWADKVNPYKITLRDVQNLCSIYSGVVPYHVLQMFEEYSNNGTLSMKDLR